MHTPIQLNTILNNYKISSFSPIRIDCGNTWDLELLALTHQWINPHTINFALKYEVCIEFFPFEKNMICIESKEYGTFIIKDKYLPFNDKYKSLIAILSYYNVSGLKLNITSPLPTQSGFGTSASVHVALIAGLSKILNLLNISEELQLDEIAYLAYKFEKLFITTGYQDHLVATYGGVHRWDFAFDNKEKKFRQEELVNCSNYEDFEKHILIAYTEEKHISNHITEEWILNFSNPINREKWLKVNEYSNNFSIAIKKSNFKLAINALKNEFETRIDLDKNCLTELSTMLIDKAQKHNCAVRFTGAGYGGGIWAFGKKDNIKSLKREWELLDKRYEKIHIISNKLTNKGVNINVE